MSRANPMIEEEDRAEAESVVVGAVASITARKREALAQAAACDKELAHLRKAVLKALNGGGTATATGRKMSAKQKAVLVAATKRRWAKWRRAKKQGGVK